MFKNITPIKLTYSNNFFFVLFLRIGRKFSNFIVKNIFKIFKFKILKSPLEALGHQIWDLQCIILDNQFNKNKFTVVIPYHDDFIANKYFFENYQKKKLSEKLHLKFVHSKLVCLLLYFQRYYSNVTLETDQYSASDDAIFCKIKKDFFKKYQPDPELLSEGKNLLKKYNINLSKKFVLLHVRDSSLKPFDNERYRDVDVNSFSSLIDYLISKGYQVVRAGNYKMKKCEFEDKIIDLTQIDILPKDKEIIDVYLAAYCDYMVGTCSGFSALPGMFGKKILSTNMAPYSHALSANTGLSMPKLYRFKKKNELMNLYEICLSNFDLFRYDKYYKFNDIEVVDNSSNEILEAFKDLEKYDRDNHSENELQKKFRDTLYRFGKPKFCYESESSIPPSFIKKYENLL